MWSQRRSRDSHVACVITLAVLDVELMQGLFALRSPYLCPSPFCMETQNVSKHNVAISECGARPDGNTNSNTNKGSNTSHWFDLSHVGFIPLLQDMYMLTVFCNKSTYIYIYIQFSSSACKIKALEVVAKRNICRFAAEKGNCPI